MRLISRSPSWPWAASSALNHFLLWNFSAYSNVSILITPSTGRLTANLLHIPKHLFSTPPRHIRIIIFLLRSPNAKRTIDTTRSSKKPSTTDFDLSTIWSRARLRGNVPIWFCVEFQMKLTIIVFSNRELCYPASVTRTELLGSSARRAARTEPDVPPLCWAVSTLNGGRWYLKHSPTDNVVICRALCLYVNWTRHSQLESIKYQGCYYAVVCKERWWRKVSFDGGAERTVRNEKVRKGRIENKGPARDSK